MSLLTSKQEFSASLLQAVRDVHQTTIEKNNPHLEDFSNEQLQKIVEDFDTVAKTAVLLEQQGAKNPKALAEWASKQKFINKQYMTYVPGQPKQKVFAESAPVGPIGVPGPIGPPGPDSSAPLNRVKHAVFGEGQVILGQHATPDSNGDISWYDVMFENEIKSRVPSTELISL